MLGAPKFKIISDHKPLQYMFNKVKGEVPPRIERMIMDLQEFDYIVEYCPGKSMIADYMSRNHSDREGSSPAETNEKIVKRILRVEVSHAIDDNSAITMKDVRKMTYECLLSQKIMQMIEKDTGTRDPDLEPFQRVKEQLSVVNGVVCKGNKIYIPPILQKKTVKLCHRAHQRSCKDESFRSIILLVSGYRRSY